MNDIDNLREMDQHVPHVFIDLSVPLHPTIHETRKPNE